MGRIIRTERELDVARGAVPHRVDRPSSPGSASARTLLDVQRTAGNSAAAHLVALPRVGTVLPAVGSRPHATASTATIQRELVPLPGQAQVEHLMNSRGGWERRGGIKTLYKDTDTEVLYAKSDATSKGRTLVLHEVLPVEGAQGTYRYRFPVVERVVKSLPRTKADWSELVAFGARTMVFPSGRYPHVTVELSTIPNAPTDVVQFGSLHYSRSDDDPYRCGYRISQTECIPGALPPKRGDKDMAAECHDAVDRFLEAVGYSFRVSR